VLDFWGVFLKYFASMKWICADKFNDCFTYVPERVNQLA